ncbi:sugar-transfer associated ATP-grasp domain-containing protein [Gillisia sp. Q332]|uniref:sugar-transfer associated ATP-grasp domain-containing protein n=1 Tax=Gillisia xinjiangensis TaxID=3384765 RepID=UPI00391DDF8B
MIKDTYHKSRALFNIINKDIKDGFPISILDKIALWRKGFLAEKYSLYELYKNDSGNYLSDYQTSMARWINEPFNEILTNKFIFSEVVGNYFKVPKTYGIFIQGIFYPSPNESSIKGLFERLDSFVVKPTNGGGGKGVYIIKKSNSSFILNDKTKYTEEELEIFFSSLDNFILTEFIEQSDFALSLNPTSVNTMRILTLIDPITKEPFIARAVQRIGTSASAPQDNFTKGGVSALINLKTGVLSDATAHPKSAKHIRLSHHPDSNIKIEGITIPNWDQIRIEILTAAKQLPMLKCVGWDFVLSKNGLMAIEGNHHPDPDVLQAHGPLLTDDRIRAFYKYYNIIK